MESEKELEEVLKLLKATKESVKTLLENLEKTQIEIEERLKNEQS